MTGVQTCALPICRLVDLEIDVFRENEEMEDDEDIDLMEFEDEIDTWMLQELRRIGLDTAKSVLTVPKEELLKRTDLEEENIDFIFEVIQKEFE